MSKPFAVSYLRRSKRVARSVNRADIPTPLAVGPNHPRFAQVIPAVAGGYTGSAVCKAYAFPKVTVKTPVKIGILSLGGSINESDFAAYFAHEGLPAPTVTQIGTPNPTDPGGANTENMLDVELSAVAYTYCTGQAAEVVFGNFPNTGTGIAEGINGLVAAGVAIISISWGAPETQWAAADRAATETALKAAIAAGVTVCVASGDNSIDDGTSSPACDYPCGSSYSWAVGGTALMISSTGGIGSEAAWGDGLPGDEGGGGGLDPSTPIPAHQVAALAVNYPANKFRGDPDSSANGDPNTGYAIFSDGQWGVVGGTSCSSPLTAGLFAAIKAAGGTLGQLGPVLYPHATAAFHDIVTGSNGEPAAAGWDQATGLGSPSGPGILAALTGAAPPPPPPPPPGTNKAKVDAAFAIIQGLAPTPQLKRFNAFDKALFDKYFAAHPSVSANAIDWGTILQAVEGALKTLGPLAVPIIEAWLKTQNIPPALQAVIDALIEQYIGNAQV